MRDVFVSYTSCDKSVAYSMVDYLEAKGVSCFIAPRDIDAGKAYASNIMKAIEECKLVLLVASNAINNSEHVLNEVDVIIEKKKDVLPVFIEDFEMNDDFRYYLGRKQWIIAYPEEVSSYLPTIYASAEEYLPKTPAPASPERSESSEELRKTKTVFEYNPDRGIMINMEDHQRNVSFRSDTLINMMGGIFEKVVVTSGQEYAEETFFSSGYVSGKNFADKINVLWDTGYSEEELKKKLAKWCEFDSSVGWGKFSIDVDFDEGEDGSIGTLSINEAILVDMRGKRKVCSFIKGYCTGVIENLLGSVDVELRCRECPLKSRFKSRCLFDIVVKG
jgi:predicted hydrocarbon binding protein